MRALADKVPAMLAFWDADLRCRYANRDYERWFGVTPESLIGTHIADLLGPLYTLNLPYIQGALRGETQLFERMIPDPRGGPPRASQASYVPHVVDGSVRGFFVLVSDITAQKQAAAATLRLEARNTETLRGLARLAGGLAHEINGPLAAALGNLDLVIASFDDPKSDGATVRTALLEARDAARRIATITRGIKLLTFEPGEEALELVDVDATLEASLAVAANAYRYVARLERSIASGCLVRANAAALSRAFVQLLTNAAQAMPSAQHDESCIRVTCERGDGFVEIVFEDNGHGVAPDDRAHVFDPFFTTRDASAARGLGLTNARAIVRAFGGELTLDPDGPTRFRVRLPIAALRDTPIRGSRAPSFDGSPSGSRDRARILVVDDDAAVGRALVRVLRSEYEVTTETDSRKALARLLGGEHFDLVISDVMMPDMTGPELYRACLRVSEDLAGRFLFMTGGALGEEAREFTAAQSTLVLKPFDLAQLRRLVASRVKTGPYATRPGEDK